MRSVLRQLLCPFRVEATIPHHIEKLYKDHQEGKLQPDLGKIRYAIIEEIGKRSDVRVVVDALHERGPQVWETLVEELRVFASQSRIGLLSTSRIILSIATLFSNDTNVEI